MKKILVVCFIFITLPVWAQDWLHWRGPASDGISSETGIITAKMAKTSVAWKAEVGKGYSSFAVWGNLVYTMGYAGGKDSVICLNLLTGAVVWKYAYANDDGDYNGPRATPLVDNGLVYSVSRTGIVYCLNAQTGAVVWYNDLRTSTGTGLPDWGMSGSPILYGNLLLLNANKNGVALNKSTGIVVWKSAAATPGYSSAVFMKVAGGDQALFFGAKFLYGVNPSTGALLWSYPWTTDYDVNAADPVVVGTNRVYISSGYGTGGVMLEISASGAKKIWQNTNICAQYNSCIYYGGKIIGIDSNSYSLRALNPSTGAKIWEANVGIGAFTAADNKILFTEEGGDYSIIDMDGNVLVTEKIGASVTWTTPVFVRGYLLTRNEKGRVTVVKLK